MLLRSILSFLPLLVLSESLRSADERVVDVCVYTATPSGILAALAVKNAGKSVVIVEPGRWVGGILGAGIKPLQDCPNPAATGGMTRKLLYELGGSPEEIRESFGRLLAEQGIEVIHDHRVGGVEKEGARLRHATFDRAPFDGLGCPPAAALEKDYLRGLHHFLSNDARVPQAFREDTAALGLDLTRHPDTGGWPHQLYIRLTRRLEGRYTLTTDDVYNRTTVDDPVALAQYGIDTYPSRRVWVERDGKKFVGLEGWMFVGGAKGPTRVPYPIPYRALTPCVEEAENLLVPVCFSATYLAYASARMEPTFMMCGEAAGIAACQSLAEGVSVQEIDAQRFRASLDEAAMVLDWDETRRSEAEAAERANVVTDFFNQADLDRDGRVSQTEWNAQKKGWEWLLPKLDENANGTLEPEEYEAFQHFKGEHTNWRKRLEK